MRDAQHATRFYYVFAVVDVYSRSRVHCNAFEAETAENAVTFLQAAFDQRHIPLVLHSDNGAAMKSAQTLRLLNERGTEVPRSRPRVSDDNPYIESLFKMMKYAGFMGKRKYKSLEHCKKVLAAFAAKYNHKWAHSSVNNVTPADRHLWVDVAVCRKRQQVLEAERAKNPERWISRQIKQFVPAGSQ